MVVCQAELLQVMGQVLDFADVVIRQIQNLKVFKLAKLRVKPRDKAVWCPITFEKLHKEVFIAYFRVHAEFLDNLIQFECLVRPIKKLGQKQVLTTW